MKQLKKTLLTLALLITAVGGAWADETPLVTITFDSNGPVYSVEGLVTLTGTNYNTDSSSGVYYWSPNSPTKTLSATVEAVADKVSISKVVFWGLDADYAYPLEDTEKPFVCYSNYDHGGRSLSETDWTNIESSERIAKIDVYAGSAASTVEVDWNKTSKTGTFTMPGGNVTLEPEYYPQAALTAVPTAINDVPATTDGAIVNAGTVANIGTSEVKQGTVMYYVSQSTGETAPEAPDYDTDGWSEDVPTANGLAQGKAYVWYYIKGAEPAQVTDRTDDNTRSDSDIMPLGTDGFVTIAAAPTYAVTFADDTAEPTLWTADPNADVKKGETVTVTYSGSKKVIGVKAEKIGGAEGHALSASAVGEIVGSDGKAYAVADKDNLPSGVTAVAMVAYKSGSNGLAIQLNASPVEKNWADAKTYAEGLTAVPGGTWRLPSKVDWQNMFVGCAMSGDASAGDNMSPIAGFKAKIAATGITWQSADYWSSTESGSYAWTVGVNLNGSYARADFTEFTTSIQIPILGCLAF